MKELSALFVSGYLRSAFFLLPLLGIYLSLSVRNVSLRPVIALHKALLLLSIALPVFMILLSYNSGLDSEFKTLIDGSRTQIRSQAADAESFGDISAGSMKTFPEVKHSVSAQDVIYYFVNMIGMFSILGLVIFMFRYAIQEIRLSSVKRGGSVSNIEMNCQLIESGRIRMPFSVGLLRKTIFIPLGIPVPERGIVIRHELNHFHFHHHYWSVLEAIFSCAFWFNPIVHILRRRGAYLRELECDRYTIRDVNRYEYSNLLLKTAESMARGADNRFSLLTQGWARKKDLKSRIENMMDIKPKIKTTVIGALILAAVVVTVGVTLLYGNMNDLSAEKEVLAGINLQYQQRVSETVRVDIDKVPRHFIDVLLMSEDSEFYEHSGVSVRGLLGAIGSNLRSYLLGGPFYRRGGSTISQQLAKQFWGSERTLVRKFREIKIARVLERNFTKNEILEMYLNMIYLGNGTYGLKSASDVYFHHDYGQMTLSESAMLVPFIKAPDANNVFKDPVNAERRQARLLERYAAAHGLQ